MLRKVAWVTMAVCAVLIALYAFVSAFVPPLRSPFVQDLISEKALRAFGHMGAGGLALAAGALQFNTRLRVQRASVHRFAGRIYVVAVFVSGVSGLLLAPTSTGGVTAHFGFGLLAVLWLTTCFVAYDSARSRDFSAHRDWMIRSYALCLAAVTLRIYLPLSGVVGIPFAEAYPTIAWLCWVPNLVIAEWFFVRGPFASLESTALTGSTPPQAPSRSLSTSSPTTAITPKAASPLPVPQVPTPFESGRRGRRTRQPGQARDEGRDARSIFTICAPEAFPKLTGLPAERRYVDPHEERRKREQPDPVVARHGDAEADHEAAQVERIPRACVRSPRGEGRAFVDGARSPSSNRQTHGSHDGTHEQ